jgi:hypothetical protein
MPLSSLRINSIYNIAQPLLLQPCQLPHRHISRVQDHPSEVRVAQVAVGEFAELGALLGYEADEGFGGNFWVGLLVILHMGFTLGFKIIPPLVCEEGRSWRNVRFSAFLGDLLEGSELGPASDIVG